MANVTYRPAAAREADSAASMAAALGGGGGAAATAEFAGRELLLLRDEAARNQADLARLRHEVQLAAARDQAITAANTQHLAHMERELADVLAELRQVEAERGGPTVPVEALTNANRVLQCRREELLSVQRDVETLEAVIRAHIHDPRLDLAATLDETHPQLRAVMGLLGSNKPNGFINGGGDAAAMAERPASTAGTR